MSSPKLSSSSSWRIGEKKRVSSHVSTSASDSNYHFTKIDIPKNKSSEGLSGLSGLVRNMDGLSTSNKNDDEGGEGGFFVAPLSASSSSSAVSPAASSTTSSASSSASSSTTHSPFLLKKERSRENIPPGGGGSASTNNLNNNSNNYTPPHGLIRRINSSADGLTISPSLKDRSVHSAALSPTSFHGVNNGSSSVPSMTEGTLPPRIKKRDDLEGLMSRAWGEYYDGGELFVQVVGSDVPSLRALQDAEVAIMVEGKTFVHKWGQDFLIATEQRSFGDITLDVNLVTRLNTRKKIGGCKLPAQGLEDGKVSEAWHNLAKRSRNGEIKSRGHIKVSISYTSSLLPHPDYCMARDRFDELMKIILDKESLIVCALCKSYREEDLSKALIRLFNSQKQADVLLTNLLTREIYSQDDTATLFRRDSMATKTARNFFSLVAKSYLKKHILPFVAFISYDVKQGHQYEVDPTKLSSTAEIAGNATRLLAGAKRFLSSILDSCDDLPISVRLFFFNLNAVVRKRIKSTSPIGALFFLRFVCPAVLFPSQYGLMEKPLEQNIFRALVLVTKILQNLVNGCLFHEEYMTIFNSFITDNVSPIHGFFEQLCTEPPPHRITQDDALPPYTEEELVQLLSIVVRKMHIYFEQMQTEIEQDPTYTEPEDPRQKYLLAKLKTMFLERILTSSKDEKEIKKL